MRFACVRIEHLPTRLEAALQTELFNQPLVVLRAWNEHVPDASPDVETSGIRPADSRRHVEQLCPQAVVLPTCEMLYQSHHESLKFVLANFTDKVETAALGEFFIEIGALSRTFSSEHALVKQIVAQAHQADRLTPAVGIAANKFTALQAARQASLETNHGLVVPNLPVRNKIGMVYNITQAMRDEKQRIARVTYSPLYRSSTIYLTILQNMAVGAGRVLSRRADRPQRSRTRSKNRNPRTPRRIARQPTWCLRRSTDSELSAIVTSAG